MVHQWLSEWMQLDISWIFMVSFEPKGLMEPRPSDHRTDDWLLEIVKLLAMLSVRCVRLHDDNIMTTHLSAAGSGGYYLWQPQFHEVRHAASILWATFSKA